MIDFLLGFFIGVEITLIALLKGLKWLEKDDTTQ